MSAGNELVDCLPSEAWGKVGQVVSEFERAWKEGVQPSISEYLPEGGSARDVLLVELVHIELELRLKSGEAVRVEEFLKCFPELAKDECAVLGLIGAEYRLRLPQAPCLTADEYRARFPHYGPKLGKLFQAVVPAYDSVTLADAGVAPREAPWSDLQATMRCDIPLLKPGPAPAAPAPVTIPGFEILGILGRGGMGVVYRARQLDLNREVALKMILAGTDAGPEERARFRLEAETAARLQHTNVVQIHEVGEHEGRPYFVLELVGGGSLAQKLGGTPLPSRQAARLAATLAEAVHAAHEQGIIHRDLKPANVLLTSAGIPKITDFGLAKYVDRGAAAVAVAQAEASHSAPQLKRPSLASHTQVGAVMGTPSYMAPEQAEGRLDEVGTVTHVHALGAILYEMLTGRPPFKGARTLDTLVQVASMEPVPPRRLQPRVPKDLETICLKCLKKEPHKRYAAALDLAADLERFLAGEAIRARPVSKWERGVKWARRRPAVAGLLAALAGVLVVAYFGLAGLWLQAEHQAGLARSANGLAEERKVSAEASRRLAEDRLVHMEVANGMRLVDDGDLFGALPSLVRALKDEPGGPDRKTAHRMRLATLLRQCPRLAQMWRHDGPVHGACFSPDGRRILTASADGTARIWDVATGGAVGLPMRHAREVRCARFSRDGKHIVTASWDHTARVWDAVTGEAGGPSLLHKGEVWDASFNRDGDRVVTASADRTARVWDVKTGKMISPPLVHDDQVFHAAFSPDGRRVVTASADQSARVWDAASGAPAFPPLKHLGDVTQVAFSPNGRWIVTGSADRAARVWDAATGLPISMPLLHARAVTWAAFSPDHKAVVTADGDGTVRVWSADKGQAIPVSFRHSGEVSAADFSFDGGRLVTASDDGTARVWDVASGRPASPPLRHNDTVTCAVFSPDGRYVVTASTDHTARLWDLSPSSATGLVLTHQKEVWHASFSADGRFLLTASHDHTAQVWDAVSGHPIAPPLRHADAVMHAAFSPNGRLVVTASADFTAQVWNTATGRKVSAPLRHSDEVRYAAFSPDGKYVVTASGDETARVWEALTGKPMTAPLPHKGYVLHAAFDPTSRRLVTAGADGVALVWDVASGRRLGPPLKHESEVGCAAFSPDGGFIVTASHDFTARIWDAATCEPLSPPLRHNDVVRWAAFSPDGSRIVTASADQTARVWAAPSGRHLAEPMKHAGVVRRAAFSADGCYIVTASQDRSARVWEAATGQPISPFLRHGGEVTHAEFCAAGDRVITASADGTARVWSIEPDKRPIADLFELAELYTGQKTDAAGGPQLLDAKALEGIWLELQGKYPEARPSAR